MGKQMRFNDSDQALIERIEEYRKAHGLKHFIDAVRKLCSDALEIARIQH